ALGTAVPSAAALACTTASACAATRAEEPHPELRAALRALERARAHLQRAAHDFGGHRVEAIAAIDRAMEQLNLAIKYDR
ncbi:MAG: hypothetical protein ACM34D_12685, partial [Gemmatimonadota bacterium]